jgi:hypothetical protein
MVLSLPLPKPITIPGGGGGSAETIQQGDTNVLINDTGSTASTIISNIDGVEAFRVASTGNFGIGTSVLGNNKLEINEATGRTLRLIYNDADGSPANYSDLHVDSTGQLLVASTGSDIKINTNNNLDIIGHNGNNKGLKLGGVLVQSTAQELNYNNITTIGVAEPSKTVILDSNKDIIGLNELTSETINVNNLNVSNFSISGLISNFAEGGLMVNSFSDINMDGRLIQQTVETDLDLINFNPNGQSENYSLEIIGYIKPSFTQTYTFYITASGGARLWVDNTLLFNNWNNSIVDTASTTMLLTANKWYPIRLHSQHTINTQRLRLQWQSPSQAKANISLTNLAWDNTENNVNITPSIVADSITLYDTNTDSPDFVALNFGDNNNYIKSLYNNGLEINSNYSNITLKINNNEICTYTNLDNTLKVKQNIIVSDVSNNTVIDILQLTRKSTGVPATNMGVGIKFNNENNLNITKATSSIQSKYTNSVNNVENASIIFNTISNGTLSQRCELNHLGQLHVTSVMESSDMRIKENIITPDLYDSFSKIKKIQIKDYNFKNESKYDIKRGVIAQELNEIMPTAVHFSEKNGYKDFHSVDTRELLSHLIASVQYIIEKLNIE